MSAGDELVDIVDDAGHTIAVVPRREMRARRLPHRCVYLLVFNAREEFFIHQRTAGKDVYPSYWDVTVGGVLAAGEGLDEGARRELAEELGIAAEPEALFPFRYADEQTVVQGMVYRVSSEGPFRLQPEEVARGQFVSWEELPGWLARERFCPDGLAVLDAFWRRACTQGTP